MKRIVLWILTILVFITVPIIWWLLMDSKNLNIAIIDKTVANDSYREHQGLVWALNHFKYDRSDTTPYDKADHYFGAVPNRNHDNITERALPTDYSNYDVLYLADTYGVYEDDLVNHRANRFGARTEKIYGGLELEEWNAIAKRLTSDKKSVLIAEFNSFASPTEANARNAMLDYIGMDWSGWVGRYFDELDFKKNSEIPQWIVDEHGDDWNYQGGGFVLVNDFTYEFFVLELGKHVGEAGINLQFTEQGKKYFDLSANPKYGYWFDIVTTQYEEDVLATYDWDLTKKGKALLKKHGIPETFAAVLSTERKNSKNFYFAGDFNDVGQVPIFYQMKGLASAYATLNTFSNDSFYWSAYVPMMEKILGDFGKKSVKKKSKKESEGYNARVNGQSFEVLRDGKWETIVFKGVNLGMGKPGYFPGEAAITEKEYYRWFKQIGEMNANTIRVYTLHPPGFYRALAKYNQQAKKPLYLLHGVWITEELLEDTLDAYTPESIHQFKEEMKTIVDVIHGNKYVKPVVGHASGYYDADISDYVIGWVIGIEWYPYMVENTNNIHKNIGQYNGVYVETKGASPFEHWLAEKMDFLLQYEQNNYGWMRPMSFTNWVTTDLLEHPSEPNEQEDLVGVNPNTIFMKDMAKQTGQFASYHVYPYYPDFFNYDKKYLSYVDHRGKTNSYAGYLADLRAAHTMPVLVAEFGIPGSRGLTHKNPYGWNQGYVSEQQQGEILKSLFEDIIAEDYLGGLIFTWQDEWFKRTWNTMDYDNPNRRPYWSNAQTNEQQFGLLSFDRHKIQVDGNLSEWEATPLYKGSKDEPSMTVEMDERYVYIQLKGGVLQNTSPQILFDIVPKQGKTSKSDVKGVTFTNGIDFIGELSKKKQSRLLIDPYYDFYSYLYGHKLNIIKTPSVKEKKASNKFIPIDYMLNKSLLLPETKTVLPVQTYEAGKLLEGNGNPQAPDYNSLADYTWTKDGIVELRIPWLLLQAKDPSSKEFMGDLYASDNATSIEVERIGVGVLFVNEQGQVKKSLPKMEQGVVGELQTFTWDKWDIPASHERLKASYTIIQRLFKEYQ